MSTLLTHFQSALVHKIQDRWAAAWASAQPSVNQQVAATLLLALWEGRPYNPALSVAVSLFVAYASSP